MFIKITFGVCSISCLKYNSGFFFILRIAGFIMLASWNRGSTKRKWKWKKRAHTCEGDNIINSGWVDQQTNEKQNNRKRTNIQNGHAADFDFSCSNAPTVIYNFFFAGTGDGGLWLFHFRCDIYFLCSALGLRARVCCLHFVNKSETIREWEGAKNKKIFLKLAFRQLFDWHHSV